MEHQLTIWKPYNNDFNLATGSIERTPSLQWKQEFSHILLLNSFFLYIKKRYKEFKNGKTYSFQYQYKLSIYLFFNYLRDSYKSSANDR